MHKTMYGLEAGMGQDACMRELGVECGHAAPALQLITD